MKLHENKELFQNYIALVSQKEQIDEAIVLKDYFVTLVLKYIYSTRKDIIFIGGTSLSKCFNLIKRFSEDIDLVAVANSRKAKQRTTQEVIHELTQLWPWKTEADNDKHSDFKIIYLHYEISKQSDLDQRVKVELMTFMQPFPIIDRIIEPVIYQYLEKEEINEYGVLPIKVLTQEPYRTFFEKITLEKELFKEDLLGQSQSETQEKRARDFYDIHKIWSYYDKMIPITLQDFKSMLTSRIQHRRNRTVINFEEYGEFKLLHMFHKKSIRKQLEAVDLKKLSIRDLNCDEIENSLREIDAFITRLLSH